MEIDYGPGKTAFGPGVLIQLTGDEIATAIYEYLMTKGVSIEGPRTLTITTNEPGLCISGEVYVDPRGQVNVIQHIQYSGRGPSKQEEETK